MVEIDAFREFVPSDPGEQLNHSVSGISALGAH
jgi:hypothetical protein